MEHNSSYSTPLSLTSQFPFCGLPLRLDTYLGCTFGCIYCSSKDRGGNYKYVVSKPANPAFINNFFTPTKRKRGGVLNQMISRKVPIHMGGMSDPFQPLEIKYRVTQNVLKHLCEIEYPIVISTKSDLLLQEPYLTFLKQNPFILVQFSFSTVIDKKSTVLEPFSTPPSKRLRAMEMLEKNGVHTACRWQPYIPFTDLDNKQFIQAIANTGSRFLTLEHLKLPIEIKEHVIFNKNYSSLYKEKGAAQVGRELILNLENKVTTVKSIRNLAHSFNLEFGAADNELHQFSDTACCCAGVASLPGFENWSKYQISYAVCKSKRSPFSFSIIDDEWRPNGLINRQINSHSRLNKNSKDFGSMEDYLRYYWNNTESIFNPIHYYGVKLLSTDFNNGNIYCWNSLEEENHE